MGSGNEIEKSNTKGGNKKSPPAPNTKSLKDLIKHVVEVAGCSEERAAQALKDHYEKAEDAILEIVAENGQESWVEKKSKKTKKQEQAEEEEERRREEKTISREKNGANFYKGNTDRRGGGRGGSRPFQERTDRTVEKADRNNQRDKDPKDDFATEWKAPGKDSNLNAPSFSAGATTSQGDDNQFGGVFRSGPSQRGSSRGSRGGFSSRSRGGRAGFGGRGSHTGFGRDSTNETNPVPDENEELNWTSGPRVFNRREEKEEVKPEPGTSAPIPDSIKASAGPVTYSSIMRGGRQGGTFSSNAPGQTISSSVTIKTSSTSQETSTIAPASYQVPPNKAGPLSFAAAAAKASKPQPPVTTVKGSDHQSSASHSSSNYFNNSQQRDSENFTKISSKPSNSEVDMSSLKMEADSIVKQLNSSSIPGTQSSPQSSSKGDVLSESVGSNSNVISQSSGNANNWTTQLKKDLGIAHQTSNQQQQSAASMGSKFMNDNTGSHSFESFKGSDVQKAQNDSLLGHRGTIQQEVVSSNSQMNTPPDPSQKVLGNTGYGAVPQQQQQPRHALSFVESNTSFPPKDEKKNNTSSNQYAQNPNLTLQQQQVAALTAQQTMQQQHHHMFGTGTPYNPYSSVPYYQGLYSPATSGRTDEQAQQFTAAMLQLPMTHFDFNTLSNLMPTPAGVQPSGGLQQQSQSANQLLRNQETQGYGDYRQHYGNQQQVASSGAASGSSNASQRNQQEIAPPPGFNNPNMMGMGNTYFGNGFQSVFPINHPFPQPQYYGSMGMGNMMYPQAQQQQQQQQQQPHSALKHGSNDESRDNRMQGHGQPKRNNYQSGSEYPSVNNDVRSTERNMQPNAGNNSYQQHGPSQGNYNQGYRQGGNQGSNSRMITKPSHNDQQYGSQWHT